MQTTVPGPTDEQLLDFGGLTIRWDHRVIKPRSWTVEQALWAAKVGRELPEGPILELFCGAGHIGLLAASRLDRELVQVDTNPAAVELARRNAAEAGVTSDVRERPVAAALAPEEVFPLVIADPPWLPSDRVAEYPEDPPLAVDGGYDGSEKIALAVAVAIRHLHPEGHLFLQVGDVAQAAVVPELLARSDAMPGPRRTVLEVRDCLPGGMVVQVGPEPPAGA
jgi:methylase of polypeptide subunit release factors